jgi:competence protein ComEC
MEGARRWAQTAEPLVQHRTVSARAPVLTRILAEEQEQWFLWLPVFFAIGIGSYFALRQEIPLAATMAATAGVLALHLTVHRRAGLWQLLTSALLATSLGATVAKLRTDAVAAPVVQRLIGPVAVKGWIELVEPRPGGGQRLTLVVQDMEGIAAPERPHRIRVRSRQADGTLAPGLFVSFRARLAGPAAPAAPHDFDFGRMAWYQALGGVGVALTPLRVEPSPGGAPGWLTERAQVERVRQAVSRRIQAALPGETGAIANALITGERGGITGATNQAYRDSGLFHILSISGLHMVIMAGAVFYLVRLLLAALPSVALRYPIKKWAAATAIVAALGYTLLSGSAFATVRAAIMIVILFAAVILDRPALALRNVALAALAILAVYPESLLDAGFQMSFAAATGLVSTYEWIRTRREARGAPEAAWSGQGAIVRFAADIVASTLIATVAVAPFAIYHFHNTQQLGLVGNIIAVPICNLVIMPAALATVLAMPFGLESVPLAIMGYGIEAMSSVARWVAGLPGAVLKVPRIAFSGFILVVAGLLWLALWRRTWRVLAIVPIGAGIILAPHVDKPDVLIGRDGATVAVRDGEGRLAALPVRGSTFELARWLEADGDRRTPEQAQASTLFRCDALACRAAGDRPVVVSFGPASLADDCKPDVILVLRYRSDRACPGVGVTIVAPASLRDLGTHAIYRDGTQVRIETVAGVRGDRPWSRRATAVPRARPDPRPVVADDTGDTHKLRPLASPEDEDEP